MSSARRSQMDKTLPSAKSHKLPVGAIIEITGKKEESYTLGNEVVPNDKLRINVQGAEAKNGEYYFPVRELLKAKTANGSEPLFTEEGGETFFPSKLTVVSSEDRTDRNGQPVYPVQAYKAFEAQIEAGAGIDWNALVESGVKDDNELAPVQNYTFMIEG